MPLEPFVEFIRRRTSERALTPREQRAVDEFMPMSPNARQNLGGNWGSDSGSAGSAASAAAAARGYTGGGPTSGPTVGSTTGSNTGFNPRSSGTGSDFVSGGGPYAGGMYSGGVYAQPTAVPTTTFRVNTGSSYPSSGYGDAGGGNFVRNETRIPTSSGLTRASSGLGDVGGRDTRVSELGDYLGEAVSTGTNSPPSLGGRYVPPGGSVEAARPLTAGQRGATPYTGYGPTGGPRPKPSTLSNDAYNAYTGTKNTMLDTIAKAEGTYEGNGYKGYNEVLGYGKYGGYPDKDISSMTMQEVYDFGRNVMMPAQRDVGVKEEDLSTAAGRYQIVGKTMKDFADRYDIDMKNTVFDNQTQDYMAILIADEQGPEAWASLKLGKHKDNKAIVQDAIAKLKGSGIKPGSTGVKALRTGATTGTHGGARALYTGGGPTGSPPPRVGMMSVPTREKGGAGYAGSAYSGGGSRGSAGSGGGGGGGQYGGGFGGGGGYGGGGTYGGSGGGNINQGVGGAYRNR